MKGLLLVLSLALLQACEFSEDPVITKDSLSSATDSLMSSSIASNVSSSSVSMDTGLCQTDSDCGDGTYCELGINSNTYDQTCVNRNFAHTSIPMIVLGTCTPIPQACPDTIAPICIGTITYSSLCQARLQGARNSTYRIGTCNYTVADTTCFTPTPYDTMETINALMVDRTGGGQIHFLANQIDSSIFVTVSSYYFNDTLIQLSLSISDHCLDGSIPSILNGETPLSGNFEQPLAETGTWLEMYAIAKGDTTRITNTTLLDCLGKLEESVHSTLATMDWYP